MDRNPGSIPDPSETFSFATLTVFTCSVFCDWNGFRSRNLKNCSRPQPKSAFQKSIFHFQPRSATESTWQNSATESLGKCQGYCKETWLLHWDNKSGTIFSSNRWVKVERTLWSNRNPSWSQLHFLTKTVSFRTRFLKKFRSRARKCTYFCYAIFYSVGKIFYIQLFVYQKTSIIFSWAPSGFCCI